MWWRKRNQASWVKWMVRLLWTLWLCKFIFYDQTWRTSMAMDDLNVACLFVPTIIMYGSMAAIQSCISLCFRNIVSACSYVTRYGWQRVLIFTVFVCIISVAIAFALFVWPLSSFLESFFNNLEENTVYLDPDSLSQQLHAPRTNVYTSEMKSVKWWLDRYEGEDVELNCFATVVWLPNRTPYHDFNFFRWTFDKQHNNFSNVYMFGNVSWWSWRHDYFITAKELLHNASERAAEAAKHNMSVYELKATLRIRLLEANDFGNYWCETLEMSNQTLVQMKNQLENSRRHIIRRLQDYFAWAPLDFFKNRTLEATYPIARVLRLCDKEEIFNRSDILNKFQTCNKEILAHIYMHVKSSNKLWYAFAFQLFGHFLSWRQFQTIAHSFTLKCVKPRQLEVTLPVGAVLENRPLYWTVDDKSDVSVEHYINGQPLDLTGFPRHCCKLHLIYLWMYDSLCSLSNPLDCLPPLVGIYPLLDYLEQTVMHMVGLCLGPEMYGRLRIEISRRYYDLEKNTSEVAFISYPMEYLLVPGKQTVYAWNMFSTNKVSTHFTDRASQLDRHGLYKNVERFPENRELKFIKDLAREYLSTLDYIEIVVGLTLLLATVLLIFSFIFVLRLLGTFLKRTFLGSDNHDRRGERCMGKTEEKDPDLARTNQSPLVKLKKRKFDVYLSFCESDLQLAQMVDQCLNPPLLVFFNPRDILPGLPVLSTKDIAITNSRKFIIFLSADYLEDPSSAYESQMIVDHALNNTTTKLHDSILVLLLDDSRDVPVWLRRCKGINCTTNRNNILSIWEEIENWVRGRNHLLAKLRKINWTRLQW